MNKNTQYLLAGVLILVLMVLHKATATVITILILKVANRSKTLELVLILEIRDINLSHYNYWNKKLLLMERMYLV